MQLLILGMHRSGTSVVARLVNLLGAYFAPDDLELTPQADNPKGFWERRDVVQLNDKILASAEGAWDRIGALDLDRIDADLRIDIDSEIKTIINGFNSNPLWMMKDPRLCLTLSLWLPILDNPVCVYVYRNPVQVARSLARRNGFPMHFALALWEYYTVKALNASLGMSRVIVNYEQIMADPLVAVASLHKELSALGGNGFKIPDEKEILGFIEKKLFHEKSEDDDVQDYLSINQRSLVELFESGSVRNQKSPLRISRNALDLLVFHQAFNERWNECDKLNDKLDQLHEEHGKLHEEHGKLHEEYGNLHGEHCKLNEEYGKLHGEHCKLNEEHGKLNEDLKHKQEQIGQLEAVVHELEVGIRTTFRSKRWRVVSGLFNLCTFAPLRGRGRTVQHHLESVLTDYGSSGGGSDCNGDHGPAAKSQALLDLLAASAKHPKRTLQLLNVARVKSLYQIFFRESASFASDVVANHLRAYGYTTSQGLSVPKPGDVLYTVPEAVTLPGSKDPLVSIIVPVYNNFDMTMSCLDSIAKNTKNIAYEVILGDDRSSDSTADIGDYVENLIVVRNPENLGFLKNCNNAAKEAKGKYLVLLNNDTNVLEGWLNELVRVVENDKVVGCVGSKLLFADGKLQEAGGIIWKDASGWNYGRGDDPEKSEYNYLRETDYVSGACFLTRHSLWKEIGGFDEHFCPAYYEDTDFSFEVRKRGYKVVYQPKSAIIHFEGVSHGTDVTSGIKQYQVENHQKFFKKWQAVLEKDHYPNGEDVFSARDRSGTKKSILVVDHYVPHFDKDAGSKHTFQYLKWFAEMGMNVKFIGDNYFRHEPYTSVLQQLGIEVLYGPWYALNWKEWLKKNVDNIDYVYLNRPHITLKYIDFIKALKGPKVLYFGHDLHYMRLKRQFEVEKDENILRAAREWEGKELSIFNKADVVYYPSEVEIKEIKSRLPAICARSIPLYLNEGIEPVVSRFEERHDLLFIGGFGHLPNVDAVNWFVEDILPLIVERDESIKLNIVGSKMPDAVKELGGENVNVVGEVSDSELHKLYQKCRVSVVPLRYGAGIKGKVLESLELQVPVVTTDIGAEGLPGAGDYLSIANDAQGFAEKVVHIYNSEKLWTEVANKGREFMNSHFSKDCAFQIMSKDIQFK